MSDKNSGTMDKYSVLKEYFGHDSFRRGQEEIIDSIMSGRDALGIMPTGAGKSICYQIPSLLMDGITLVISPLISLMKDQVNSLVSSGINAAYINSSLTVTQYREVLRLAYMGVYRIIYVAPERLTVSDFVDFASAVKISMVTVDEAHCVSQWGQDFRPSYLKIAEFIGCLPYRPVVSAFTATATTTVRDDIIKMLNLNNPFVITTGFDRKNLYFGVIRPKNKYEQLKKLLLGYEGKSGIIYCISRRKVEEVCEKLRNDGYSATRYHAGLTDAERRSNQDDFIYDRCTVMVATNAFGMGIDKSNVSFVIHFNMPKNLESYYQEAGRAGRDGEKADCILMYNETDVRTNRFLIESIRESGNISDEKILDDVISRDYERLKYMKEYSTSSDCLRERILRYFGEKSPCYCGNCSSCLSRYETTDVTVDAQKIISCVYRLKQQGFSYGRKMIADVLSGKSNEKIRMNGFENISTYGIMKETSQRRIYMVIDYLIENKYLLADGKYQTISILPSAAGILKGSKRISMRIPQEEEYSRKTVREDSELFDILKELRSRIAAECNVPAYIVFSDSSLRDMCSKMPVNRGEFLNVSGVGKCKVEKYGDIFCETIVKYINGEIKSDWIKKRNRKNNRKDTVYKEWTAAEDNQLYHEIKRGMTISEIAAAHKRSIGAITSRLKKMETEQ
jgi:ATP-dependent DNA helicase RecQ